MRLIDDQTDKELYFELCMVQERMEELMDIADEVTEEVFGESKYQSYKYVTGNVSEMQRSRVDTVSEAYSKLSAERREYAEMQDRYDEIMRHFEEHLGVSNFGSHDEITEELEEKIDFETEEQASIDQF